MTNNGLTDLKGLAVSTTSSEALGAYERGVDLFLRWRAGALEALDAAAQSDPRFALAHATKAYITSRMGRPDLATVAGERALALADDARTDRERSHVGAVAAMQHGDQAGAQEALARIAAAHPRDRVAVRLTGLHQITQGDYRGGVDIARRSLDADPGEPQYLTMLGFFLEQSGDNAAGFEMSRRSLALDPTNLYTYHAVGHAYQARGDYADALETFQRAVSLERYGHLVWHLAEAHAILGNERLSRDYWSAKTLPMPLHERIDVLWRWETVRGRRADDAAWRDLAREADRALEHPDYQTTWMHHWYGVAFGRAGERDKALRQLARLRGLPEGRASGHWSTLGAGLLEGELALMDGDLEGARRFMAPAIERLDVMGGGSREQKDIFRDVFMEIHRRLGRADEVIALAQQRLRVNPSHLPSLAALAWAHGTRGDVALQRDACRRLVERAEQLGVAGDTDELVAARQVLGAA